MPLHTAGQEAGGNDLGRILVVEDERIWAAGAVGKGTTNFLRGLES